MMTPLIVGLGLLWSFRRCEVDFLHILGAENEIWTAWRYPHFGSIAFDVKTTSDRVRTMGFSITSSSNCI